ncbi:MAG: hypothetical protein M0Q49_05585, partial [Porticoccaceae bacterium]|nr:hypothetical protein [Porticoccaceae bacterium]
MNEQPTPAPVEDESARLVDDAPAGRRLAVSSKKRTLIFEQALHQTEDGALYSYWPERWPVENLLDLLMDGTVFFGASYQNDPSGLAGKALKREWLHGYDVDTEIELARKEYNVNRGIRHVGLDPTQGGESNDTDFMAGAVAERLGNRLYPLDYFLEHKKVEDQAPYMDEWMELWEPNHVILEENSSRGFVYVALTTQINDGNGTRFHITVENPQNRNASMGAKLIRFLNMAARFQTGQIRLPARRNSEGELVILPEWQKFIDQWVKFPSGHDDALDAMYWCQYSAFKNSPARSVSKDAAGNVVNPHSTQNAPDAESDDGERVPAEPPVVVLDRRG